MIEPMREVNQRLKSADATIMPSDAAPSPPSSPTVTR